jgi:N,N'-diacetyllegionaminate synthase
MSCEIIAEISSNHGGDMSLARDMIDAAASSGADYAKFQTWKVSRLKAGPWDHDGRREIYEKAELSEDDHSMLKEHCDKKNIKFLTSCFSIKDLEFISGFMDCVKIPGTECRNKDLVWSALDLFEKVFVSIGASEYNEYLYYTMQEKIYLMHCVSMYPCPNENINMRRMKFLASFNERYGYSGHGQGVDDAILAIGMGAKVVEKHFTIDHNLPFRDNKFAILPSELKHIVEFSKNYNAMMIDYGSDSQTGEKEARERYAGRWE